MGFWDALFGNAPQIQMSDQAKAYSGGTQLDFSNPYNQGMRSDADLRQQQAAFLQALGQQAQGRGPAADLANAQFQNQLNQGNAAMASQIAGARGMNPAAAIRLAAQQGAAMNQGAATGAAALRAQQQLGAMGQLGSALGQFRGQEQALAGLGAQGQAAQNQLNSANYNAAQGLNAQIGMAQAGMQQQANQAGLQALAGGITGLAGGAAKILGFAHGGSVEVDSKANDTVPAMLQEGETVVPASLKGRDRQDFLEAYDAMQNGSGPGRAVSPDAFLKALAARDATIERRIQRLEELIMRSGGGR